MADYKDLLSTFNLVSPIPKREIRQNSCDKICNNVNNINGIIFTDTTVLAEKFSISREHILNSINNHIELCKKIGIIYALCDMAEHENSNHIATGRSWYKYHKALYSYIERNHINKGCSLSVFIIGGDDVITVPQYVFDLNYDDNGYKIEIDLWYCFEYGFDIKEFILDKNRCGNLNPKDVEQELLSLANLNIARLPLTNGLQKDSFDSTIGDYLNRSIKANMTVDVNAGMMTTALQWLRESTFVANDLPLLPLEMKPEYVCNGIYISPYINTEDVVAMQQYKATLKNADFLLFNLHGDVAHPASGYYGSPLTPSEEGPCAFNVPLLNICRARILNTMACYGARYIGYNKDTSILLSAIYGSFLSFVGSSHIALGKCSNDEYPCGCSETLLKIYTGLLLSGIKAGEALLKAKIKYISHFSGIDPLPYAYYTICEFNLFGSPSINCGASSCIKSAYSNVETRFDLENVNRLGSLDDAYERVRNLVDTGLNEISHRLGTMLTNKYGYVDVHLSRINRIMRASVQIGYDYIFTYNWGCTGYIRVRTNNQGDTTSIYYTK